MNETTTLAKPTLIKFKSNAALAFAEAEADDVKTAAYQETIERRAFVAPKNYRRLTINLPEDLHKKLRLAAIDQDCTATDIIERPLVKELGEFLTSQYSR